MDKARSMLSDASLSQDYQAKAIDTTCYLINRWLTSTLVEKNPYEAWASKNPSLVYLKVFGCDSFVHIPKERRKKLNIKSEKCIFIGYKDIIKGYKLWNIATRNIFYNRDVIFREDESYYWNEEVKREKKLKNLEFDLRNGSHDSDGSTKRENMWNYIIQL